MPKENHSIVTRSALRVWWLVNLRGYKIQLVKDEPTRSSFGRVVYKTSWTLRKDAVR